MLLITGVGSLIHIYSIGYMAHEEGRRKFFAYLNLFVAAMLLLVLGNGFVTLYFGWEGVGLASYLLIGWYQYKPEAASAAKKAFLMNRVGDLGLAIAIFLMFNRLGTTQYTEVFSRVGEFSGAEVLAITLLLLLGACGKSGQFPLQAWLPDAMAGPTPVSALIHAATMVTAGVYLIARSNPLYNLSDDGRLVVMIIGGVTLLIGCIIGCAYDDFKKVLAYSTVSQIGYMILAVGLGPIGYALGIMHLLTHGFFKAGLFLGAGSVMHGMNDEGNIRQHGRAVEVPADHVRHLDARLPRADRHPAVLRLLLEGRHHRGGVRRGGLARVRVRRGGPARCRADRVLHDAPADPGLPRQAPLEGTEGGGRQGVPPARVPADDDRPDDHPRGRIRSVAAGSSPPTVVSPAGSSRRSASCRSRTACCRTAWSAS